MKPSKPRFRIKAMDVSFVSLVPRGANLLPVVFKDGENTQKLHPLGGHPVVLGKDFEEEGLLTCVVYIPGHPDSQGHVIDDPKVIRDAAHAYLQKMGQVDVRHNLVPFERDQVAPVESFIIQKGDPRFADYCDYNGTPVDPTGGWAQVIKIGPEEYRAKYRSGEWNGVSLYGTALLEPLAKEAGDIPDALSLRLGQSQTDEDDDMKPEELAAALEKNNETLADKIVTGLAKALKPEDKPADNADPKPADPKPEPIAFEGDPTKAEDVEAHQRKLRLAAVDWNDPKSVAAYQADLKKDAEAEAARKEADEKDKSPELVAAEKELATAQAKIAKLAKSSNQDAGDDVPDAKLVGLSKEDMARVQKGRSMAAFINQQRGYAQPKS